MDTAFALGLARACVAGKVRNARQVLLRGARDSRSEADAAALTRGAQDLAATLRALPDARDLDALRGLEGEAARQYFERQPLLVKADLRSAFSMNGRTRRPPRDRMNALLSFLYAMWMNDCRSALESVGLDPQVGFLHVLRPGRAALALDLMEEFRSFADRLALSLVDLAEREAGITGEVVTRQIDAVLSLSGVAAFSRAVVAYERVWAIGTGRTASPAQAQEVRALIRQRFARDSAEVASRLQILYGGSVKPGNAKEFFGQPDIDGGLIGGASLVAGDFLAICAAA